MGVTFMCSRCKLRKPFPPERSGLRPVCSDCARSDEYVERQNQEAKRIHDELSDEDGLLFEEMRREQEAKNRKFEPLRRELQTVLQNFAKEPIRDVRVVVRLNAVIEVTLDENSLRRLDEIIRAKEQTLFGEELDKVLGNLIKEKKAVPTLVGLASLKATRMAVIHEFEGSDS
jgi:hypothetical protein